MENLTKQQIILLTLLVSFVTSIATGIVTVSLLDQAPKGVTETINRVVEKTVERVIQVPTQGAAAVIQKETIVVKEDDQTVSAIEKNSKSIVRIYHEGVTEANPEPHKIFEAMGIVVSKDGMMASTANLVGKENLIAEFSDNAVLPVNVISAAEGSSTVLLSVTKTEKSGYNFVPVHLGDSNGVKLGQAVIGITGRDKNAISVGIISSIKRDDVKSITSSSTPAQVSDVISIETTLNPRENTLGSPLLSLSGDVIGIITEAGESAPSGLFDPASLIVSQMDDYNTTLFSPAKKN